MNSEVKYKDCISPFFELTRYLLVSHPFFAQLLAALPKKEYSNLACPLSLSWFEGKPVLLYQNELLNQLLKEENKAVEYILHELLHLLFNHGAGSKNKGAPKNKENDQFYNIATDIQVWSWLSPMLHIIPDYLQCFRPIFEAIQQLDVEEIVILLSNNKIYKEAVLLVDPSHFVSHQYWLREDGNYPVSWQLWWSQLKLSLPLDLLSHQFRQCLALQSKKSKSLPWPLLLRRFASNTSYTYNKNSLRRPSKRYGTVPGVVRKKRQNLLVIIDTSGSVEEQMLQLFFNEIHWLYRQGAQVTLLQADDEVQEITEYKGQIPKWIWGRGGTSFDPALKYANEKGAFDGVIYFTDGKGVEPSISCQWPLLWVIGGGKQEQIEKIRKWQGRLVIYSSSL